MVLKVLIDTNFIKVNIDIDKKIVSCIPKGEEHCTLEEIQKALSLIGSVVSTYRKNNVVVTWFWDLRNITTRVASVKKVSYIQLFLHNLRAPMRETVYASAVVISSKELGVLVNNVVSLLDPMRPTRIFNSVENAVTWLDSIDLNKS